MSTKFCANILKVTVGEEKAKAAFQSISMGAINSAEIPKTFSNGQIIKAHTHSELHNMFANKLANYKEKVIESGNEIAKKKQAGKSGIDAYIAEDGDESNDSFEDVIDQGEASLMSVVDPS